MYAETFSECLQGREWRRTIKFRVERLRQIQVERTGWKWFLLGEWK